MSDVRCQVSDVRCLFAVVFGDADCDEDVDDDDDDGDDAGVAPL